MTAVATPPGRPDAAPHERHAAPAWSRRLPQPAPAPRRHRRSAAQALATPFARLACRLGQGVASHSECWAPYLRRRRYICLAVRSRVTRATGEHAARRGASRATGEHAAPSGCDDACGRGWSGSTRFAARLPVTQSRSTHVEVCSRCAPSFLLHSFSSPALPDCSTSRSGSCSVWIMSVYTKMLRSDLKLLNERKRWRNII